MISEAQVKAAAKRLEDISKLVQAEIAVVTAVPSAASEQDAKAKVKKLQQLRDRETFAMLQWHTLRMQSAAEPANPVKPNPGKE